MVYNRKLMSMTIKRADPSTHTHTHTRTFLFCMIIHCLGCIAFVIVSWKRLKRRHTWQWPSSIGWNLYQRPNDSYFQIRLFDFMKIRFIYSTHLHSPNTFGHFDSCNKIQNDWNELIKFGSCIVMYMRSRIVSHWLALLVLVWWHQMI